MDAEHDFSGLADPAKIAIGPRRTEPQMAGRFAVEIFQVLGKQTLRAQEFAVRAHPEYAEILARRKG